MVLSFLIFSGLLGTCHNDAPDAMLLNGDARSALSMAVFGDARALRTWATAAESSLPCGDEAIQWRTAIGLMTTYDADEEARLFRQISEILRSGQDINPVPLGLSLSIYASRRGDCRAHALSAEWIASVFGSRDSTLIDWLKLKAAQGDDNSQVALLLHESKHTVDTQRGQVLAEILASIEAYTSADDAASRVAVRDIAGYVSRLGNDDIKGVPGVRQKRVCPLTSNNLELINRATGFEFD